MHTTADLRPGLIGNPPKKDTWRHPTLGHHLFVGEAVEVEAIDAPILREVVETAVTSHLDPQALDVIQMVEKARTASAAPNGEAVGGMMGGQLVKAAIRCGHGLPLCAYKCLMHMAVSIMPDNIGAPTYYGGRDALVRAVYGQLAPKDSKRRENQYRQISENLKKLRETGLIDPLNEGHKGHRVNYRLTLNEPAKGGSTAHPIKGESTAHPLDDQKDAKGELTALTKGELRADSKGGSTAHPKEASTGSNKQEASADSGPQTETAVETEPETAVGSLITSSNHLQKSTTVGTRQVMDEIGIGNGKTQDQKRCKHHPCGVYESQHHRLAEFGIEPHDFTWWPDNDSKPDERKRRRRNYAVQNRYQNQQPKTPKGKAR